MKQLRKIYLFLGSLKLAVLVILGLAVISGWGTIMEAQYNTETAQKLVYHSWWMVGLMIFLCANLIISALHRWPWKKRHVGFVVAHVGILVLLGGSYVTKKHGIDGSLAFGIGETNRYVQINDNELAVYIPLSEAEYLPFFKTDVDFLTNPPSKKPVTVVLGDDKLEVVDFYPYANLKTKIEKSTNPNDGPALRFQISGQRVNVTDWIQQSGTRPGVFQLGPAQVLLSPKPVQPTGENEIILIPKSDDEVNYSVYSKSKPGVVKKGILKIGDVIQTGWMDISFRVLNLHQKATVQNEYIKLERPTALSTSAAKLKIGENEAWVGLNSMTKISAGETLYLITYGNKRLDLGFNLTLKDFRVGRYEGTSRAASYESEVLVEGGDKEVKISMNEPLVHKRYTFYQASFQEDPQGRPTASILSVNYDPGRWWKYLGAALIVLGTLIMFYFKRLLTQEAK
jgi:hypothetical protein